MKEEKVIIKINKNSIFIVNVQCILASATVNNMYNGNRRINPPNSRSLSFIRSQLIMHQITVLKILTWCMAHTGDEVITFLY